MRRAMLTTIDNPYDPFTHFKEWYEFDVTNGYHSCAYLGRIAVVSDELSEADHAAAIESAIDEIVRENPLNVYRKVVKDVFDEYV